MNIEGSEDYLNSVIQTLTPILKKFINHKIEWEFGYNNIRFYTNNIRWIVDEIDREMQETTLINWRFKSKFINNKSYYCFINDELEKDIKIYNRKKYLKELI